MFSTVLLTKKDDLLNFLGTSHNLEMFTKKEEENDGVQILARYRQSKVTHVPVY